MRGPVLLAQLGLTMVTVAILLPPLLVAVPALRAPAVGPLVAAGLLVLAFVLIRLVWPKARR